MAGLTRYYQKMTREEPLVGLWRGSVVHDLLWVPEGDSMRKRPDMPSWSWLSVEAEVVTNARFFSDPSVNDTTSDGMSNVLFLYLQSLGSHATEAEAKVKAISNSASCLFPEFVGSKITWSGTPLTSSLLCSELVICRRILPCRSQNGRLISSIHPTASGNHQPFRGDLHAHGNSLEGIFDIIDDTPGDGIELLCMLMTSIGDMGEVFIFLVLQPVAGSQSRYRRIGLSRCVEIVWLDIASMDVRDVTLT